MTPTRGGRPAHEARWLHVPEAALVVADQLLLSGGNFVTLLILGRWLPPSAFGTFALGFAALLLAKNFHLALVSTPLMAIGGAMPEHRQRQYRATLGRLHVGYTGLTALVIGGGGLALARLRPGGILVDLVVPLTAAAVAFLGQEFVRRALLTARRRGATLFNDALRFGIQVPALIALRVIDRLGVASALWVLAAGCAAGAVVGWFQLGRVAPASSRRRAAWYRDTLAYGKWLAGHYAGVWLIERWTMVAVAALLSTAEAGVIAACVTLFGITNVFYLSLENYAIPVLARRIDEGGTAGFRALFGRLLIGGGALFGVGCLGVALAAEPLLTGLFGLKYTGYGWFLSVLALSAFVGFFARVSAIGLKIQRRTREVFWAYVGSAAITVTASVPLIADFGLRGAGWVLVSTQLALAVPLTGWLLVGTSKPAVGAGGLRVALRGGR